MCSIETLAAASVTPAVVSAVVVCITAGFVLWVPEGCDYAEAAEDLPQVLGNLHSRRERQANIAHFGAVAAGAAAAAEWY